MVPEREQDVEDGVDDVGRQRVDEEAEYSVLELAVLEGAVGRPENQMEMGKLNDEPVARATSFEL